MNRGRLSYVRSMIKLKQQEEIIENGIESFLKTMKIDSEILQDIQQIYKLNNIQRKKLTDSLCNLMTYIAKDFDTIDKMFNQLNKCEKIDIHESKLRLTSLLKLMNDYQPPVDIIILENEQKELDDYMYEFKISMDKYEGKKGKKMIGFNSNTMISKIKNNLNYNEVKDFNDLIAKTGHYQYWKEDDHLYYLKMRKKCQTISSLVDEIQKKFPDLTEENIKNHDEWYKTYIELRKKQRDSVEEWRKKKESEKKEQLKLVELDENDCQKNNIKSSIKNKKIINKNDDKKKELLNKWKIEKEKKKIIEKKLLNNKIKEAINWKEKKFLTRSEEIKKIVKKYKENKKINNINLENKNNDTILKSQELIASFRKNDNKYIEKKKDNLKLKNNNNLIVKKINKDKNNGTSTLLNTTKIWEEKCKQVPTIQQFPKPVLYIKNLPKL
ncbi:hypothetical protein HCN44_005848 [Aphidius gifuensis]|uniref:Uncharacterized protein n=3 Tax=Aphidius gifuensis TaxID=684658 RepID=A0A834XWV3_APHGI|nr:hypothetical protein HCN44_005848 [Aphidius gifuensis]